MNHGVEMGLKSFFLWQRHDSWIGTMPHNQMLPYQCGSFRICQGIMCPAEFRTRRILVKAA